MRTTSADTRGSIDPAGLFLLLVLAVPFLAWGLYRLDRDLAQFTGESALYELAIPIVSLFVALLVAIAVASFFLSKI